MLGASGFPELFQETYLFLSWLTDWTLITASGKLLHSLMTLLVKKYSR